MVVNYVATAGLSALIIVIYYVAVHDPSVDPFEKAREKTPTTRPNSVDDSLLTGLRSGPRYLMKCILGSHQVKTHSNVRLERTLVKVCLVSKCTCYYYLWSMLTIKKVPFSNE